MIIKTYYYCQEIKKLKCMEFNIDSSTSILNLKKNISKIINIPVNDLLLSLNGNLLENKMEIQFYEIDKNSITIFSSSKIKEFYKQKEDFLIYIKTLTGQTITLEVNYLDKTDKIFELISKKISIPIDQQRLIYAGRQIETDRLIYESNIQKDSSLHLVLRLRGGMYEETSGKNGNYEYLDHKKEFIFFIKNNELVLINNENENKESNN
jgi:ubiquitin C